MTVTINDRCEKDTGRSSRVRAAVGVLLAATFCAIVGPAAAASAQTAPQLVVYPLPRDTDVSGPAENALLQVDLALRAGESRRVVGQVEALMKSAGGFSSIDDTVGIQCLDLATGAQAGVSAWTETSLVPGVPIRLRPSLLFTPTRNGQYRCRLVAVVGSGADGVMTALEELTYLAVSAADEVGAHWWQNPDCDSEGNLPTCTYLGPNEQKQSALLLSNDGTPLSAWTAAASVTVASVTANVELTTCGHTASCGGRRNDYDYSMVTSRLEAVQLSATGQACSVTASSWRTDRIDKIPHHFNIAYSLRNVPVRANCGSRNFLVRVNMQWVYGNPVKIDGSRPDPEAETNAFMVASAYGQTTTVPSVMGLTPAAAQPVLAAAQLTVGTVSEVESSAPAGTIVAQIAAAGTVEPVGSSVNLFISHRTVSFVGLANANKPGSATSLALSDARGQATAAGFSLADCVQTDSSVQLNQQDRSYDASVTLTCSR